MKPARLEVRLDLHPTDDKTLGLLERYSEAELAIIADFLGRNAAWLREETRKLEAM